MAVWDLATGKETRVFSVIPNVFDPKLAWANDFLLVDNRYLYDADHRVLLWDYQSRMGQKLDGTVRKGRLFSVQKGDDKSEPMFISTAVPHTAALEMAKNLPLG